MNFTVPKVTERISIEFQQASIESISFIERLAFKADLWLQAHTFEVMIFSIILFAIVWGLILTTWNCEEDYE